MNFQSIQAARDAAMAANPGVPFKIVRSQSGYGFEFYGQSQQLTLFSATIQELQAENHALKGEYAGLMQDLATLQKTLKGFPKSRAREAVLRWVEQYV